MKIILYIAQSRDGYIATADGGVAWLDEFSSSGEDYGFHTFFDSIDVTLIGGNTYRQILTFGEWPYSTKESYVFTHEDLDASLPDSVHTVEGSPKAVMDDLAAELANKNVWLVGGATLLDSFLADGLVDEMRIFIMPKDIGDGIPLFTRPEYMAAFEETASKVYGSGAVEKTYQSNT